MDMGKEAKIGVGVILGLFIVLCVALAVRINGSKEKVRDKNVAFQDAGTTDQMTLAGDWARPRLPSLHQPTVLSARGRSAVTLKPSLDAGGWSLASDNSSRSGTAATPPSLMPNPSATPIHATAFTVIDSAAPSTIPATATDSAAGATPAVAMAAASAATGSNAVTAMPAVPPPPTAMTLPTITPPPLGTSSSAAPASKGYDFSQRSGSSIGSSNPDGSNPALTTTPPPASLPVSSDTNSATTSYPSASPYGSPSSGTSAATSTYRQSRYGYGLPTDSTAGPPQAALGNSTVPDAGAMAGSAMAAGPMPSSGRRDDGTYKVRPNDNYWTISEKLYGTGAYFRALAEVNRDRTSRDDHLRVGAVLQAPPAEELEKNYADLCPKANHRRGSGGVRTMSVSTVQGIGRRVYVVEQGDTLMDVARRQLGKASRWAEIYELNRDKLGEDHDYLVPGMQLAMPEPSTPPAGRNDSLTERPGSYYRR